MKIAVYTVIFNNYDLLRNDLFFENDIDYIAIVDDKTFRSNKDNKLWKLINIGDIKEKTTKTHRLYKYKAHDLKNYDILVYIDGNIRIKSSILNIVDRSKMFPVSIFKHPQRSCVFEEFEACCKLNKDSICVLNGLKSNYHELGVPKSFGLWETNFIIFNTKSSNFVDIFCSEYKDSPTIRDQLVLPYVLWKHNLTINTIPEGLKKGLFNRMYHKKNKIMVSY